MKLTQLVQSAPLGELFQYGKNETH